VKEINAGMKRANEDGAGESRIVFPMNLNAKTKDHLITLKKLGDSGVSACRTSFPGAKKITAIDTIEPASPAVSKTVRGRFRKSPGMVRKVTRAARKAVDCIVAYISEKPPAMNVSAARETIEVGAWRTVALRRM
jgi:hypothetical protein